MAAGDPFDAARLDVGAARGLGVPAWQSSLRHELGRLRGSRRRVLARFDAVRQLQPAQQLASAQLQVAALTVDASIASIGDTLDQAQSLLDDSARAHPIRRLLQAGGVYEAVLAGLHRGRESLFLVEDDAWVRAQLPTLRAGVATIMGPDDPRTEGYLRSLDDLIRPAGATPRPSVGGPVPRPSLAATGPTAVVMALPTARSDDHVDADAYGAGVDRVDDATRELLRAIQVGVDDARMAAQVAVRVYRNALVVAICLLALAAVAFPSLAGRLAQESRTPSSSSGATADPSGTAAPSAATTLPDRSLGSASAPAAEIATQAATQAATQVDGQVDGQAATQVDGQVGGRVTFDRRYLSAVEVWGVLGSLVAIIAGLSRLRSSRQPTGLQLAQLALKLPAGALTALFGVLLLQGGLVLQLDTIDDPQVPAYAILFGFAQQGLTRFVDGKAGSLLERARPLSDRAG